MNHCFGVEAVLSGGKTLLCIQLFPWPSFALQLLPTNLARATAFKQGFMKPMLRFYAGVQAKARTLRGGTKEGVGCLHLRSEAWLNGLEHCPDWSGDGKNERRQGAAT